jgi:hypothetical protein
MIRAVASTIVERPMLTRNGDPPSIHALVHKHISDLPYMIECFHNAMVTVTREMKWCKIALLRKRIPIEVFTLIQPFLFMKDVQDFYPSVLDNRVPRRKYLLIESKLYRMELANDATLKYIRWYIENLADFKEGTRRNSWILWCLHTYTSIRTDFLRYALYLLRKEVVIGDEFEAEIMMRYWF